MKEMPRKTIVGVDGWETIPTRGFGRALRGTATAAAGSSTAASTSPSLSPSPFPDDSTGGTSPQGSTEPSTPSPGPAGNTAKKEGQQAPDGGRPVYIYAQLFCGFCGRYVTDVGGLASAGFAADVAAGRRAGPGEDMLRRLPEYLASTPTRRFFTSPGGGGGGGGVEPEPGPHGLSGAANFLEPLVVMRDPRLPRLFLEPWLCFH